MHAIFASERGRRHQASWDEDLDGLEATPDLITARQVLRWATLDGAKVAGIADRTGSITPGKKADLVIIDGVGGQRRADHRSGRRGGLRRRHLERQDRDGQRRDPQARRQARGRPEGPAAGRRWHRATTWSARSRRRRAGSRPCRRSRSVGRSTRELGRGAIPGGAAATVRSRRNPQAGDTGGCAARSRRARSRLEPAGAPTDAGRVIGADTRPASIIGTGVMAAPPARIRSGRHRCRRAICEPSPRMHYAARRAIRPARLAGPAERAGLAAVHRDVRAASSTPSSSSRRTRSMSRRRRPPSKPAWTSCSRSRW